ncbi:MAG: rhodanese-like domain-containing protein [Deltaproteobacteria bacterium]|nr:rhodanese-like domain-containing protein [Deltaproteobacteria bacterium]
MSYFYRMLLASLLAAFLIGFTGCGEKKQTQDDHKAPLVAQNQNPAVIIDVRDKSEFADGHLEVALNIPTYMIGGDISKYVKNKSDQIILYCNTGNRANYVKQLLEGMGYANVTNGGGYRDMLAKGYK